MPTVRAAVLADFAAVARECGVDPAALLREVGLAPRQLAVTDLPVDADTAARLLELAAARSGCPSFGLRLALRRRTEQLGVSGLLLTQQPTARAALAIAIRYRHLLTDALALHLEEADGLATVRVEAVTASPAPAVQALELGIAAVIQIIRLVIGPGWRPHGVHLVHAAPASRTDHHRAFGCPVTFDSPVNALTLPAADLDRPNPAADAALARYAQALLDHLPEPGASVVGDTVRLIHLLLPLGQATITHVAATLGRNVRTLQRELAAEGTGFGALVDGVRAELAQRYLADRRFTVGRIAAQLGYANHASFTRWFAASFGLPPAAWRQDARR